jgi:hypothetical protein
MPPPAGAGCVGLLAAHSPQYRDSLRPTPLGGAGGGRLLQLPADQPSPPSTPFFLDYELCDLNRRRLPC